LVKVERPESSQPAKNPLAEAATEKAKSRFAERLHNIELCLPAQVEVPKSLTSLPAVSLCKGYRSIEVVANILKLSSWLKEVAMLANKRNAPEFRAATKTQLRRGL
jgi:hypothetical protein